MKRIILLITITFLFGCNQKKDEIELVRVQNENEYLFIDQSNYGNGLSEMGVFSFDEVQSEMISKSIEEIKAKINELKLTDEVLNKPLYFSYKVYVNGDGKIEKLASLSSISEEIDKYLISQMSKWEMNKFSSTYPLKYAFNWDFTLFKPQRENYFSVLNSSLPISETLNKEKNQIYFIQVEEMPEPIGGIKAIQEKIKYPEFAKKAGIEGRVYVKAFIDENGDVVNTEIIKGLDGGLNEAALEAVKTTKFVPGKQRGKAVKVQVSVPILFKLQ